MEAAFLLLLRLLITSIDGLLLCTAKKVLTPGKNLHLSLYVSIWLKNKRKIDVLIAKVLGDNIISLALTGFLCFLGIQDLFDNR